MGFVSAGVAVLDQQPAASGIAAVGPLKPSKPAKSQCSPRNGFLVTSNTTAAVCSGLNGIRAR